MRTLRQGKSVPCQHEGNDSKSYDSRRVVFTDFSGPLPVESVSGKKYFITFTDSFSSFKDQSLMRENVRPSAA